MVSASNHQSVNLGITSAHVLTFHDRANPGRQYSHITRTDKMDYCSTVPQADVVIIFSVTVSPECVTKYNELKLGKTIKYIIYRLTDDYKEIVVEESSTDDDWEVFQEKLLNAKASHKGMECKGPRYAVYDFQYELEEGEGIRCFVLQTSQSEMLISSQKQNRLYFVVAR